MTHTIVHKLKFAAMQLTEARAYITSVYALQHLDNAFDAIEESIEQLGGKLLTEQEERV